MKAVLQRVSSASVVADGVPCGACGMGFCILLGVAEGDTEEDAVLLADKIAKLRVFSDDAGKMNLSLGDIGGEVLIVSNFTLNANYAHGNRPDFLNGAKPEVARALYLYFVSLMEKRVSHVGAGVFGADMQLDIRADGPVTIVMDSLCLRKKKGNG